MLRLEPDQRCAVHELLQVQHGFPLGSFAQNPLSQEPSEQGTVQAAGSPGDSSSPPEAREAELEAEVRGTSDELISVTGGPPAGAPSISPLYVSTRAGAGTTARAW
jgi:hypothetical protein